MRKMAENEHQNTIKHILYVLKTYKLDFFLSTSVRWNKSLKNYKIL